MAPFNLSKQFEETAVLPIDAGYFKDYAFHCPPYQVGQIESLVQPPVFKAMGIRY